MQKYYKTDPINYITDLIGHEGENSLLSLLIEEELAFSLVASGYYEMELFSVIEINITLTELGKLIYFFSYKYRVKKLQKCL